LTAINITSVFAGKLFSRFIKGVRNVGWKVLPLVIAEATAGLLLSTIYIFGANKEAFYYLLLFEILM
jgi:hypothetical protein